MLGFDALSGSAISDVGGGNKYTAFISVGAVLSPAVLKSASIPTTVGGGVTTGPTTNSVLSVVTEVRNGAVLSPAVLKSASIPTTVGGGVTTGPTTNRVLSVVTEVRNGAVLSPAVLKSASIPTTVGGGVTTGPTTNSVLSVVAMVGEDVTIDHIMDGGFGVVRTVINTVEVQAKTYLRTDLIYNTYIYDGALISGVLGGGQPRYRLLRDGAGVAGYSTTQDNINRGVVVGVSIQPTPNGLLDRFGGVVEGGAVYGAPTTTVARVGSVVVGAKVTDVGSTYVSKHNITQTGVAVSDIPTNTAQMRSIVREVLRVRPNTLGNKIMDGVVQSGVIYVESVNVRAAWEPTLISSPGPWVVITTQTGGKL